MSMRSMSRRFAKRIVYSEMSKGQKRKATYKNKAEVRPIPIWFVIIVVIFILAMTITVAAR